MESMLKSTQYASPSHAVECLRSAAALAWKYPRPEPVAGPPYYNIRNNLGERERKKRRKRRRKGLVRFSNKLNRAHDFFFHLSRDNAAIYSRQILTHIDVPTCCDNANQKKKHMQTYLVRFTTLSNDTLPSNTMDSLVKNSDWLAPKGRTTNSAPYGNVSDMA